MVLVTPGRLLGSSVMALLLAEQRNCTKYELVGPADAVKVCAEIEVFREKEEVKGKRSI
jgi:hypothetical protein